MPIKTSIRSCFFAAAMASLLPLWTIAAPAISELDGSVDVRGKYTDWTPAKMGQELATGNEVRTGPASYAGIYLEDGSSFRLGAETSFKIEEQSKNTTRVSVLIGTLEAWIKKVKRGSRRRYAIRTPTSVAAVRGTIFRTEVFANGGAIWDLFEGLLGLTDEFGNSISLSEGLRLLARSQSGLGKSTPQAIPPGTPGMGSPPGPPGAKGKGKNQGKGKGKKGKGKGKGSPNSLPSKPPRPPGGAQQEHHNNPPCVETVSPVHNCP
jgi:hypothetical protein